MIERIVLLKLVDGLCDVEGREAVAAYSARALSSIPGVLNCAASIAADSKTEGSWDVCLKVHFTALDAYETYAVDPTHLAYLEEYLPSRITFKKAWNFELGC